VTALSSGLWSGPTGLQRLQNEQKGLAHASYHAYAGHDSSVPPYSWGAHHHRCVAQRGSLVHHQLVQVMQVREPKEQRHREHRSRRRYALWSLMIMISTACVRMCAAHMWRCRGLSSDLGTIYAWQGPHKHGTYAPQSLVLQRLAYMHGQTSATCKMKLYKVGGCA